VVEWLLLILGFERWLVVANAMSMFLVERVDCPDAGSAPTLIVCMVNKVEASSRLWPLHLPPTSVQKSSPLVPAGLFAVPIAA